MKLYKEKLLSEDDSFLNILTYVSNFDNYKLSEAACELAQNNLRSVQFKMKDRYDKYTQSRSFQPGNQFIALLPVPDKPLQARYFGPYIVTVKLSDLNYIVSTPDRRKKTHLCHINMLKSYVNRDKKKKTCSLCYYSFTCQNCNNIPVCDTQNSQDFENQSCFFAS